MTNDQLTEFFQWERERHSGPVFMMTSGLGFYAALYRQESIPALAAWLSDHGIRQITG